MRGGLGARMLVASGALAVLVAAAFLFLFLSISELEGASDRSQRSEQVRSVANNLQGLALELEASHRGYVVTGDEQFLESRTRSLAAIPSTIAELERLVVVPEQRSRVGAISAGVRSYAAYSDEVVAATRSSREQGRRIVAGGEGKRRMDALRALFAEFAAAQDRLTSDREDRARAEASRSVALALTGLVGSMLLIVAFAAYLARSIAAPVRHVAAAARRLGSGDLAARVPVDGPAEIAELARSYNTMAASLEEARDELESQNAELEAQTGELEANQLELAEANDELQAQQVELEHALAELATEKTRVETFYEFGELIASETEEGSLAPTILRELADTLEADVAVLYTIVPEEEDGELRLNVARGVEPGSLPTTVEPGTGLAGRALAESRPVAAAYGETGLRLPAFGTDVALRHELNVPLSNGAERVGLLTLGRVDDRPFSPEDLETLDHLARQTAIRISNRVAFKRARRLAAINRAVLDATPDAIVLVDLEGRRLVENAAAQQLTGDSESRPKVYDGLEESAQAVRDPEALLAIMRASQADREFQDALTLEVAETGQAFLLYTAPVRDDAGTPTGRIFVLRDISAEHEAGRLKSELLATVSHELRTPLASILGFSELMIGRELEPERTQRYVRTIHAEARRLTNLINDFLDLQRIEAGGFTLDLQPFDLAELLEQQASLFAGQSAGHEIVLSLPDEPPRVLGEPARIAQVVANLVSNAIKYSPEGGRVEIVAHAHDGFVRVSVRDHGLGIPADQQRLIFTKFFRVDSSDTRAIGGTGLGLALAREIAEAHGGTIGFDSAEGEGSTFWFELPVGTAGEGGSRRVMVVEDDPVAAELLRTLLAGEGLEVEITGTGEEAVARATAEPPALVCLDIELAGEMDGWDVLVRLKDGAATQHVPIMICTGRDGSDRARALGACDFLAKPFSADRLAEAVARVLGREGGSVLVVDDDPSVRRLVVEALAAQNVELREASDGEEALRAVRERTPDAIVLDLGLPGLDGFGVLERLHGEETTRRIPVIVLTARRLSGDERAALNARAVSLLEKSSYSAQELRDAVRRALGNVFARPRQSAETGAPPGTRS